MLGYIRSTPNFPAANHTQPGILFGDGLFEAYGAPAGSIFGSYGNLYQFRFNMTGLRGNHAMKWGAEIRINRDTTVFGTAPNGAYSFGGGTAYSPVAIQSLSGKHNINVGDPLPDSLTGLLTATPYFLQHQPSGRIHSRWQQVRRGGSPSPGLQLLLSGRVESDAAPDAFLWPSL